MLLGESLRIVYKSVEAEMWINGQKVPLKHFVQETIANIIRGFSKTLKGLKATPEKIELKIKKLTE